MLYSKKMLASFCVGLIVVGAVGGLGYLALRLNDHGALHSENTASVVTYSTDTPDETKPDDSYDWTGAPDDPKKITVPSIGVDAYVQNVGVDQNSAMAVPTNIHVAGWFVDSVRPGEKGLSIIDGHLNGPSTDGIFIHLERVRVGAAFTVEFGDGTVRTFIVKDVQKVDLASAAGVLYSQAAGIRRQLNLITCGGDFDRSARLYDKRIIVISERAGEN